MVPFDAELNSTPNPSAFRNNPSSIANPDREYLKKALGKLVFWVKVVVFARRPLLEVVPFDAELNSAPNPSAFRNNPSCIANRAKKSRIWC
jgi:hypothetical protein